MGTLYKFRAGFSCPVEASTVAAEVHKIRRRKKTKGATPEDVVEAATPPEAPLHDAFEWDDEVASHKWRLDQARRLVRSVEMVYERAGEPPRTVYAFVSVAVEQPGEGEEVEKVRQYVPTETVAKDTALCRSVVEEAQAQLEAWRRRFAKISALASVLAKVDEALEELKGAKVGV